MSTAVQSRLVCKPLRWTIHDYLSRNSNFSCLHQTRTIFGVAALCRVHTTALRRVHKTARSRSNLPAHASASIAECTNNRIARRTYSSYRHREQDDPDGPAVPFEGELEPREPTEGTTLTGTERKAFEELLKPNDGLKAGSAKTHKQDSVARSQKRSASNEIDAIVSAAVASLPRKSPQWPPYLSEMSREVEQRRPQAQSNKSVNSPTSRKAQSLLKEQMVEYEKIESLLKAARTDDELWSILQKEVFDVVQKLDLDHSSEITARDRAEPSVVFRKHKPLVKDSSNRTDQSPKSGPSLALMGTIYPKVLLLAMQQFRDHFPASPLGLAILPALRNLGRGSFALGASTDLYNETMSMMWQKFANLNGIDRLLKEMGNGAVDFNERTLDIIDAILEESATIRRGGSGTFKQAIWDMETNQRGFAKLEEWTTTLKEQLQSDALHGARESQQSSY